MEELAIGNSNVDQIRPGRNLFWVPRVLFVVVRARSGKEDARRKEKEEKRGKGCRRMQEDVVVSGMDAAANFTMFGAPRFCERDWKKI